LFSRSGRAQSEEVVRFARISSIEVKGNRVLNATFIIAASGLKAGDRATPTALLEAQKRILQTGNFGMRRVDHPEDSVKVTVADVNSATNEGKLVIQVEENDVVKAVNITGSGPIETKEIIAQIQTYANVVLNINTLRADVERIQKYYDSKGYMANVSEEGFGLTNGILDIPIVVGKVGLVTVSKSRKVSRKVKWAEHEVHKALKPGNYYNRYVFEALMRKLENKGIDTGFDYADRGCLWDLGRAGTVNLKLGFREKK